MDILNKHVLVLNKSWIPIGTCSVKKAFEDLNSSKQPKKGLKIEYLKDSKGNYDFSSPTEIIPLGWSEWITLSPRDFDQDIIRTVTLELRIPTVIIVGSNYNQLPIKTFRCTKKNLYDAYDGICAYSGRKLSYKSMTIDHVIPKSRSGQNTWKNLVPCDEEINRTKADRTPEEAGLKLRYKLKEPKPVPAHVLTKSVLSPDWNIFLKF